jgi:tetratricopeptide (TPR) repeat protein
MKINIKQKNYPRAVEIGYEAAQIDSSKVEIWQNMGLAYFLMDLPQNSIDAFSKVLELGDTSYNTASHLGYLYYITGYYGRAVGYFEKALKEQPDELEIIYLLARAGELCADYKTSLSAVDDIQRRMKHLDSLAVRAELIRGNVFKGQKRYEDAVKTYSAVLKADPSQINLILTVAKIYDENLTNKKEAINWYSRYLNRVSPKWEQQDPERQSHLYFKNRIEQLKTDLFYEMGEEHFGEKKDTIH